MKKIIFTSIHCRRFFLALFALFFYCEFIIYYVVLLQCFWPQLNSNKLDGGIFIRDSEEPVKAMLLADTHLLGSRNGHWFDKLRREWQMHRTFQTAMTIHKPDVVFVLGDLFDEGLWCSDKEFDYYVKRFHSLFSVPDGTQIFVVVGNHDIGFHYGISPYLNERFQAAFKAPPVQLISIRGNHFVLLNSMAMEGDGCFLCLPTEIELSKISWKLKCSKGAHLSRCEKEEKLEQYSRPILLQHFPMYRESDAECEEPDQAPAEEKNSQFRERWECLSRESSELLYDSLNPRAIITGHTHHGCHKVHGQDIHEWTLPSFSWRNKNNPSFMLATITPNNFSVNKCYMPKESTVINLYIIGGIIITLWVLLNCRFFRLHPLRRL